MWQQIERVSGWIEREALGWREPYDTQLGISPERLRRLSAAGLEAFLIRETTGAWRDAALRETERRNAIRQGLASWAAVVISIVALCVSVAQCSRS
jgi:hypothetical protein